MERPGRDAGAGRAAGKVVGICLLWAVVHSLSGTRTAKGLASRFAGERYRNGLYRALYNAQALATLLWAARAFLRLPDRELYRAEPPLSWLFRVGQAASLGVLLSGVRAVGVLEFAGLTRLWALLAGRDPGLEPEAQGPRMENGEMRIEGAFRITRHPGNLGALGIFLFFPRMTVNRAVLAALVALYVVLGSLHEERRLRAAYGAAYEHYRRSSVPFLIPRPRR